MNFEKTNVHDEDNDYGYFCVLEENTYMNNYHQKVYVQNNRYITMHDYVKPSLYPINYYYDDLVVNIPQLRLDIESPKPVNVSNSQRKHTNQYNASQNNYKNDDDDNGKGTNKKIFVVLTQMCIFTVFISSVVVIMTMR